uniref:Uncharacterized protein MANES_17G091300 n=1 Tax=Rhizophora mucronata TaxID=61149 RepID=A0A2P2N4U7_RHIMU
MSELHSLAYTTSNLHNSNSLGWDLQNLGVLNADMSLVMDGASTFFSSLESDFSTGYLEDALIEFRELSKRRRLLLYADDHQPNTSSDLEKSCWNANLDWKLSENFSCMSHMTTVSGASDEFKSTSMSNMSEEAPETLDSSSSSYKYSAKTKLNHDKETQLPQDNETHSGGDKRKEKEITRVVYPFALVKPGGVEGDVTLNDINERILMPPTRPVRHPVGDFACRPCVSADGPGLSGKAVVALTRIHTQGRGTITIIRTRG